jgi:hypothetical protein
VVSADRQRLTEASRAVQEYLDTLDNAAFERSRHHRKKIEILFVHLMRILSLREPREARKEFLLATTAQNLRRLAKLRPSPASRGWGMTMPLQHPEPDTRAGRPPGIELDAILDR